jgi:hypothetical protein
MPQANPITLTIDGARYRLIAVIDPVGPQGTKADFTVRAIHLATGHTSVVNQVNAMLALFFAGNYPKDWPWTASWVKAMEWLKSFAEIGKTATQLDYIEDQLGEDRAEGEWANVIEQPPAAAEFDLVETVARSFLKDESDTNAVVYGKDDPSVTEMQSVLNDPARFDSFVEWISNDLYDWLRDNWSSWITNERGVPVLDDDDAEDSDAA